MNSVEAKKGLITFILLTSAFSTLIGAYKAIPAGYQYLTQARYQEDIKNLQIKELSSASVTISWETANETEGFILYGTDLSDITRVTPKTPPLVTHQITIKNLKPRTAYYYKLGTGNNTVGEQPYQFTTTGE